MFHINMNIYFQ